MNRSTLRRVWQSIVFSAFLLMPFFLSAQDYLDDPRYDRVPQWALDSMAKQRSPESTTTITINGWDNFKVGLDFAEGHIVENPQNPVQYFNCFNTTAAHYTNDGLNFNNTTVTWGAGSTRKITWTHNLGVGWTVHIELPLEGQVSRGVEV